MDILDAYLSFVSCPLSFVKSADKEQRTKNEGRRTNIISPFSLSPASKLSARL